MRTIRAGGAGPAGTGAGTHPGMIELTLFEKSGGPLTKRIYLDPAGKLVADGGGWIDLRRMAGEAPPRPEPRKGNGSNGAAHPRIINTHDYCDPQRELVLQVVRYDPKTFQQRRPARLRRARKMRKLSREVTVARLGILPACLGYIMRGQRTPWLPVAMRLADELGITLDALCGREGKS